MFNFLHTFIPNPIAFSLGSFDLHWYGLLMVVGGSLGLVLVIQLAKYYSIKKQDIFDLAFYFVLFAVIGARIYYVIYAWSYYQNNLWDMFKIWQGGLAVHGVMLGGFTATIIYALRKKLNFWLVADLAVVGLSLAQIVGRIGNYFNQEIFGKPTDLPWGIPIGFAHRPIEYITDLYFHPTFLYESFGSLIIVAILIGLHWLRLKKQKSWLPPGMIFFSYLFLYSIMRFCLEFLRLDFSPLIFGVRWAQLFSVLIVGVSFVFAIAALKSGGSRNR